MCSTTPDPNPDRSGTGTTTVCVAGIAAAIRAMFPIYSTLR